MVQVIRPIRVSSDLLIQNIFHQRKLHRGAPIGAFNKREVASGHRARAAQGLEIIPPLLRRQTCFVERNAWNIPLCHRLTWVNKNQEWAALRGRTLGLSALKHQ
jgi:hypothetical protein